MLRATADAVLQRILQRFPPGRAVTLADLGDQTIPRPVAHFLGQTLQRRLEIEAQAFMDARTRWFDYAHREMKEAQERFFDVLSRHALLPGDEWQGAVENAVGQVVPYLVRPAHVLGTFVFSEGRDVLPTDVVLRRMQYFGAYPYLNEVVTQYVRQRSLANLDRAAFVGLLQRVEHRTQDEYAPEALVELLAPLYETVGEGGRVSSALLAQFFADKGMMDVAQRLESRQGGVSRAELPELLRPAPAAPLTPPIAPALTRAPAATPPVTTRVAPTPDSPATGPVPRWMQFQQGAPPAPPTPARVKDTPLSDAPPPEVRPAPAPASPIARTPVVEDAREVEAPRPPLSDAKGQPLWQRFRRSDGVPPASPLVGASVPAPEPGTEPDRLDRLEYAVLGDRGAPNRKAFIRKLFSGSEDAYRHVLERLRAARSWGEASQIIAEAFRHHQVNIYHEAAVTFTDAAEARFIK